MITIDRARIASAAQSPTARKVARCLIGCALTAVSVALDRKTDTHTAAACRNCA